MLASFLNVLLLPVVFMRSANLVLRGWHAVLPIHEKGPEQYSLTLQTGRTKNFLSPVELNYKWLHL